MIPNGVLIPPEADAGGRENHVVFIGRHDPRKGMPVLLRAWPEIHRRTGARLRLVGADPLMVRLALSRVGEKDADGIDALGFLSQEELTEELLAAKALVAPSLGGESFGMVLTRAFACATPVVASDITGYRDVMTDETGLLVPPGDPGALADAVAGLLVDEPRRQRFGVGFAAPCAGALLLGRHRPAALGDLRGARVKYRMPGHAAPAGRDRWSLAAARRDRAAVVARSRLGGGSGTPSTPSAGSGWSSRSGSTCSRSSCAPSPGTRSSSRRSTAPHPRFPLVFSAFSVGLFANAVLPGRIGELARVAVLTRKLRLQGRAKRRPGQCSSARSSHTGSSTSCRRWG